MPNFVVIAAPLNQLTKKDNVLEWSGACQEPFDKLKHALISAPVLVYPKFGPWNKFILETDASTVGLSVLSQIQDNGTIHPVAYASCSVDKHERNYGISENHRSREITRGIVCSSNCPTPNHSLHTVCT